MTTLAHDSFASYAANDDAVPAGIVSAHLAQRRMQTRVMLAVALLAVAVLTSTIVHGYTVMRPLPDMVTFAFRV